MQSRFIVFETIASSLGVPCCMRGRQLAHPFDGDRYGGSFDNSSGKEILSIAQTYACMVGVHNLHGTLHGASVVGRRLRFCMGALAYVPGCINALARVLTVQTANR